MATIVDSYSESNRYGARVVSYYEEFAGLGQSFTGDGGTLNSVKFLLQKSLDGDGGVDAYVKIYTHSGTFGTSSVPTGEPLATSNAVALSSFPESYGLVAFEFSGDEKITLSNGTYYVATIEYLDNDGGDGGEFYVGLDGSSPSHGGNASALWILEFEEPWHAENYFDLCFYVYKDDATVVKDIISQGFIPTPR